MVATFNNLICSYDATVDGSNNIEMAYDAAGNTTVDQNGYQYIYDYENRIRYIKKNSGSTNVAFIRYDALGRRIHKTDYAAGKSNLYYYNDKWQVLQEYNIQTPGNRYVYGNYIDEVLVMDDGTDKYYYAHNHLFSPVALLDDTGAVVERYEYNAYGKAQVLTDDDQDGNWFDDADDTIYAASQLGNPYLFTGRRLDTLDSGNYEIMYYRNRYYCTQTGRFLTQDPLGTVPNGQIAVNPFDVMKQYTDGLGLYQYVLSLPILFQDLFGLSIQQYEQDAYVGPIQIHHVGLLVDGVDYDFGPEDMDSKSIFPAKGQCGWKYNDNWTVQKDTTELTKKDSGELEAGTGAGKECCDATIEEVKDCIEAECKRFNDSVSYWLIWPNCRTFRDDTKSKCCLETK